MSHEVFEQPDTDFHDKPTQQIDEHEVEPHYAENPIQDLEEHPPTQTTDEQNEPNSYQFNANPEPQYNTNENDSQNDQKPENLSSPNSTLSLPNLTGIKNTGQTPILNNIFVIQSCGKVKTSKKRSKKTNQVNEEERSIKRVKKRKSKRNNQDQHRGKRKRKRQPKKVIILEEHNYVPAYKERI